MFASDQLLPDVTPIPEGFPSSDAASILCAVGHLMITALSNPRTNFTPFRVSPYIVPSSTPRQSRVIGSSSQVPVEGSGILPFSMPLPGAFVLSPSVGDFLRLPPFLFPTGLTWFIHLPFCIKIPAMIRSTWFSASVPRLG